jgi:hypothetical protein
MKQETFTSFLPVKLTPEELKATSDTLATSVIAAEMEEEDQSDAKKAMKTRLDEKWGDVHRLAQVVREGSEQREVECYETKIYDLGLVRVIRSDTGESVSSRTMKDSERNVPLFDASEAKEDVK